MIIATNNKGKIEDTKRRSSFFFKRKKYNDRC